MYAEPTQEHLVRSEIAIDGNILKFIKALIRPAEPFVMINLLAYREYAGGDYQNLTGEEAYLIYAESAIKTLAATGSRLLWSGNVDQKITVGNAPEIHSIALLEYASPRVFFQYLTKGASNLKAREAGLLGQWLISSSTLDQSQEVDFESANHLVLVELWGGLKQIPELQAKWDQDRKGIYQAAGGKRIWYGQCDQHIIGQAAPEIECLDATWFPDREALEKVLVDPERAQHLPSLKPYLAYTASTMMDLIH
jgi:hypothetical protein